MNTHSVWLNGDSCNDACCLQIVVPGPAGNKMQRDFQFHACLGPEVSQADVINLCGVPQLLDAAMSGYNVTIFAYGQTGVFRDDFKITTVMVLLWAVGFDDSC